MGLKGEVALVTGGAVRLGKAIATGLAERGADVAITYNSSAGPAGDVVSEIEAMGRKALALKADFAGVTGPANLVEKVVAQLGRLDILVNSAAIFERGRWDDTSEENWDRHFAINLKAPFFLSQAFGRYLKGAERTGHIVNIADWRGDRPGADHFAYTLTKVGLIGMTKSLALSLAPGIQVNAVAPGMILPPPGLDASFLQAKAEGIPAKHVGSPDDVVRAVLYLVEADFVTGDVLYVTGGEHL